MTGNTRRQKHLNSISEVFLSVSLTGGKDEDEEAAGSCNEGAGSCSSSFASFVARGAARRVRRRRRQERAEAQSPAGTTLRGRKSLSLPSSPLLDINFPPLE
eukprot:760061-Hanusia_phi.AAC.2